MKEDIHHLTLTEHQLEILAIALQSAIHRTSDNELMAKLGDFAFIASFASNTDTYDQDFNDLHTKIIDPVHKRIKTMAMGEQYT